MLTRHHVVVILLTLSFGHVTYASDYKNSKEDVYEEGTFEAKITADLSALQIEIKQILASINKNIPEQLDKNNQAIQDAIHAVHASMDKNQKLEKNILDKLENYLNEKFNSLEKHVYGKIDALEKKLPDKTDTSMISYKLDALKKLQLDYDGSVNCTLANKTSQKNEEDFNQKLNGLDLENTTTTFDKNLDHKMEGIQKKIPELKQNMDNKMDALQIFQKDVGGKIIRTMSGLGCKEQRVNSTGYAEPYHRIDNVTLKHLTYTKDAAGVTYFEMRLAIKGTESAYIILAPEEGKKERILYHFGFYHSSAFFFRMDKQIITKGAPNILSPDRFTAIYVKIFNNGTLEMGKEGNSSPLITYTEPAVKLVEYFHFAAGPAKGEATFLYDCPSTAF